MARELCNCKKPIISLNSYVEEVGDHKYLIQEYGCRNPKCDRYNVVIRKSKTSI